MKKIVSLLLTALILLPAFVGCSKTPKNPADSTVVTTDEPYPEANPVSDFEYTVGEDGGVTITKYVGSAADVVIPEQIDGKAVTVIGKSAFHFNQFVNKVVIPDTVTSIEVSAFSGCSVATVRLSKDLETIGNGAFQECVQLSSIELPGGLKSIGMDAFQHCQSLKHINIPRSVTEWGREAFVQSGIESISLEDGLESVGEYAFFDTPLKEVTVPGSVKTILIGAFGRCRDLKQITLDNGIKNIECAFTEAKITEIVIPASVESISKDAFWYCTELKQMKFEGNAPENYFYDEDGHINYTVYYHEGAEGFTSPEWNGFSTKIW